MESLITAIIAGDQDVVRRLAATTFNFDKQRCAVVASRVGNEHLLRYFVALGADILAGDNECIRFVSSSAVLWYLLALGADIRAFADECMRIALTGDKRLRNVSQIDSSPVTQWQFMSGAEWYLCSTAAADVGYKGDTIWCLGMLGVIWRLYSITGGAAACDRAVKWHLDWEGDALRGRAAQCLRLWWTPAELRPGRRSSRQMSRRRNLRNCDSTMLRV